MSATEEGMKHLHGIEGSAPETPATERITAGFP